MSRAQIGLAVVTALCLLAACETPVAPIGGQACTGACASSSSGGTSGGSSSSSGGSSGGGEDAGDQDAGPEDAGVCVIAGVSYDVGAIDPDSDCLQCLPADTASDWTAVADGTTCSGGICLSGACSADDCYIGTTLCASGAQNPDNPCQACQPSVSQSVWTSIDGVPCTENGGNVCAGGSCQAGCYFSSFDGCTTVSGALYAPGTLQSCQACSVCAVDCPLGDAGLCLGEWTWQLYGTACGSGGEVCQSITPYTTPAGAVVSEGCGPPPTSSSSGSSSSGVTTGGSTSSGSSSGSSGSSSSGGDWEGTLCTPPMTADATSNCPNGLSCANWSPYASGFDVCRIPCSQGCPSGEVCSQDVGGATTTCQCSPAEAPGDPGDSCAAFGLICHPDFRVCMAPQTAQDCTGPLSFASLWSLCLAD